jgi:hypothetical protein
MHNQSGVPILVLLVSFLILPLGAAPGFAQWSAPGAPIFDCANAAARHARMASGLGVQDDAIRRTQAQIDALKEARAAGTTEARDQLMARSVDTVKSHASDELEALTKLQEKAMALPADSTLAAARQSWAKEVLGLEGEIDALKSLAESFQAGQAYGAEIQRRSHTLVEHLKEANKLFVDSGLAEAIGGDLAKMGGPLGVAAFEASLFALDYMVADMDSSMRQIEQRDLEDALWNMRHAYGEVTSKMADLEKNCPAQFGRDESAQSPPTASTSLTPPLPEPPASDPPAVNKKSGGSGAKAAVAVVGVGAAVGAAIYAGKLAGDLATMSGGSCASSRFCIVSVMSSGCECAGSVSGACDWTGAVAGSGESCGAGVPCAQDLSCNNGRCEGPKGRCPF